MTSVAAKIEEILTRELSPESLEVIDDSASHAGHAGNPSGDGETHFHVNITATVFNGKSRVAQQRLVNTALKDLMDAPIHALSMQCKGTG